MSGAPLEDVCGQNFGISPGSQSRQSGQAVRPGSQARQSGQAVRPSSQARQSGAVQGAVQPAQGSQLQGRESSFGAEHACVTAR